MLCQCRLTVEIANVPQNWHLMFYAMILLLLLVFVAAQLHNFAFGLVLHEVIYSVYKNRDSNVILCCC